MIRFIEHGNRCRPAMDCVPGELLIYRVRRCPEIEKELLFTWIKQLIMQLEQYHRCRNDQCYRYVNPYSVLVTKEEDILLLDMEAQSNEFVLKNMQKRAMREHFVRPIVHIKENTRLTLDLYGYAKTVQFLLASMKTDPALTWWEQYCLERVLGKCLSEDPKKQYEDLAQVEKGLPAIRKKARGNWYRKAAIRGLLLVLGVCLCFLFYRQGEKKEQEKQQETVNQEVGEENGLQEGIGVSEALPDGLETAEEEINVLEQYLLRNTVKDDQEVIRQGEKLHRELLRYLAAAYDRVESKERALRAYQELCGYEDKMEYLEQTYVRRMVLERELHPEDSLAVETGKEASVRFPASKQIAMEYAEAVIECIGLSQAEKKEILQPMTEHFPVIRETENYLRWESEQETEKKTESTEEDEEQGKESEEQNETENAQQNKSGDTTESVETDTEEENRALNP